MSHRKPTRPKKDKAIYTHTAKKTKKINVAPKIARGGIRL